MQLCYVLNETTCKLRYRAPRRWNSRIGVVSPTQRDLIWSQGGSSWRGGGNAVLGLRLGQIRSVGCYVDLLGMFSRFFKCLSFKTLVQE